MHYRGQSGSDPCILICENQESSLNTIEKSSAGPEEYFPLPGNFFSIKMV